MISPGTIILLSFGAFIVAGIILVISYMKNKKDEPYKYHRVYEEDEPSPSPCEPSLFTPSAYMSYVTDRSYKQDW